jgi:hypothetical protein
VFVFGVCVGAADVFDFVGVLRGFAVGARDSCPIDAKDVFGFFRFERFAGAGLFFYS